jgi:hypothetical protein
MQLIPARSIRRNDGTGKTAFSGEHSVSSLWRQRSVSLGHQNNDQIHRAIAATAQCPGCGRSVCFWTLRDETPRMITATRLLCVHVSSDEELLSELHVAPDIPEPLQRSMVSTVDAFNSRSYAAAAVCARRATVASGATLARATRRRHGDVHGQS